MKSAKVYEQISSALAPLIQELEFKKLSGSRPKWFKDLQTCGLHIYLKTDKYPWEPYAGCSISIQTYICPIDTPKSKIEIDSHFSRSFFEKGSDLMKEIQKRNIFVAQKIKDIDLNEILADIDNDYDDLEYLKLCHESATQSLDHETQLSSIEQWMDTELKYLDDNDIAYWSDFIAGCFAENVARIERENNIA